MPKPIKKFNKEVRKPGTILKPPRAPRRKIETGDRRGISTTDEHRWTQIFKKKGNMAKRNAETDQKI